MLATLVGGVITEVSIPYNRTSFSSRCVYERERERPSITLASCIISSHRIFFVSLAMTVDRSLLAVKVLELERVKPDMFDPVLVSTTAGFSNDWMIHSPWKHDNLALPYIE